MRAVGAIGSADRGVDKGGGGGVGIGGYGGWGVGDGIGLVMAEWVVM